MYNFDEIIDRRNTNSVNTDGFRGGLFHAGPDMEFPYADDEFIRMWVADMEFATPPEICEAIKQRVDRRIFGYTNLYDGGFYDAFSGWCRKMYDWSFPREELVFSPGLVPAVYQLVEILLTKNEKVLMSTPAYGSFRNAAVYNGVEYVGSDLVVDESGYFTIDFDDLETKASDPMVKLLIWCNPHNPTGRMWTAEELRRVGEIAEKYNLWLVSDEIHCDLIRSGRKHIPMGKVMPDYGKLITLMSASKTFNIAGLMFSDVIIRNKELRREFVRRDKIGGLLNPLSLAAHQAAYEKCSGWLTELREYLDGNFSFLEEFLRENLPEATFSLPEATYLAWVNIGKCIPDVDDPALFFANNAGVLLEGGDSMFVGNAEGYVRLNLAMPRSMVQTGLERMLMAIEQRRRTTGRMNNSHEA